MKFRVTMKDPDSLYDAIRESVSKSLANIDDIAEHEKDALADGRVEDVEKITGKWFEYGEYLTVEVDTEAKTCVAVPLAGK